LVKRLAQVGGRVLLDFGCGGGAQAFFFEGDFRGVIGVDVVEEHLDAFARAVVKKGWAGRFQPVLYDGTHLPLADESVDFAVSFEVLEHVEDDESALGELGRVVQPGGFLCLSVPNRWWVFETHGADLPLLPWNRVPFFSWLPRRIHDRFARARVYARSRAERLVEDAGFEVIRAAYITAPMDAVKSSSLKRLLRGTVFRSDSTRLPFLATSILIVGRRLDGRGCPPRGGGRGDAARHIPS
jgi:ubiquinone/menaquinone biosynthesis C-methylase UbiE